MNSNGLLRNDRFFGALPYITLAAFIFYFVWDLFIVGYEAVHAARLVFLLIKTIGIGVAVKSFKDHNKNVMKAMEGFLLGVLFFESIVELSAFDTFGFDMCVVLVVAVIFLFVTINHFRLVNKHESDTDTVMNNELTTLIFIITAVAFVVIYYIVTILASDKSAGYITEPIVWALGVIPPVLSVVSIETRVNDFKLKREENGYVSPDKKQDETNDEIMK